MPLPTNFDKKNSLTEYNSTNYRGELKTIYFRYVLNSNNYGSTQDYTDYASSGVLTQYNEAVDYYNNNNNFTNDINTGVVKFDSTTATTPKFNYYVVPYTDDSLESINIEIQTLDVSCTSFGINNKTYNTSYTYDQSAIDSFNTIISQTQTVCNHANYFLKTDINITTGSFNISLVESVLTLTNTNDYVENLRKLHILKQTINSIRNSRNFTSVNTNNSALKTDYESSDYFGKRNVTKGVRVKTLFDNLYTALDRVINIFKGVLRYVYDDAFANATNKLKSAKLLITTSEDQNPIALNKKNIAIDANNGKVVLANTAKTAATNAKNAAASENTAVKYLASKNAAEVANTAAIAALDAVVIANNDTTKAKTAATAANNAATKAKEAATLAVTLTTALNTSIMNENTIYSTNISPITTFDDTEAKNAAVSAGKLLETATKYVSDLADYVDKGKSSASTFATNANTALENANTLAGMNILNKYQGTTNNALKYPVDSATSIQTTVDYITTKTRELYQMSGSNVDTYKSQYSQTMAFGAVLTIILSILIYFVFSNIYNEGLGSSGNGSSNMPLSNGSPGT
jgi:hypothetical protein